MQSNTAQKCINGSGRPKSRIFASTYYKATSDMSSNIRSAFIEVQRTAENAASDGFGSNFSISPKWFKQGSRNFTRLSGRDSPRNLSDMKLLAASNRLKNAIKYRTKVRKNGCGLQRVQQFGQCLTKNHRILHGHPRRLSLQPYRI